MNRVIIPDNTPAVRPVPEPAAAAAAADSAPAAAPVQEDARDALAGALPAWDLLPATPFIRRMK